MLRLDVAYDGTDFHGFAENTGVRTVAGELRRALETVVGVPVELTCAGRTDRGVHARGQVVTVRLPEAHDAVPRRVDDAVPRRVDDAVPRRVDDAVPRRVDDPVTLRSSLVALLGPEVVVTGVSVAPPGFDARFSATSRTYRYEVWNSEVPSPFLHRTTWWVDQPLDVAAMDRAARRLVGEHDFTTFCRRPRDRDDASLVRRVDTAGWERIGGELLRFTITASAFCHQMVRSIVGLLVEVGRGRREVEAVATALRARDRSHLPTLAPPQGLTLWEVGY